MNTKQIQLNEIKQQILSNNVCSDLADKARQLVFGSGNADAQIVFIGEAPGKKEDLTGEPFVGASGKFLNEMLASIKLERSDIYITNLVKYRPPDNRDPLADEKIAFLPYLKKQLSIINPKLIVTLGRHSLNSLLPGLIIGEVHGRLKRVRKEHLGNPISKLELDNGDEKATNLRLSYWNILPLFHPAAALYNGRLRQTLKIDFALIPTIMEKINN